MIDIESMNKVTAEKLKDTQEQIELLEDYLRQSPDDFGLRVTLTSLRSMESQLLHELTIESQPEQGTDNAPNT